MNKKQNIQGIVLTRKNIGEADRLLSIFSAELGKIKVVAKGSRKIKSKMASHIEPFTVAAFQILEGHTFYILTGAEKVLYFNTPNNDIELYKSASYLCELVDLTFEEEVSNQNIYNILYESLQCIREIPKNKWCLVLRYFELKLLNELGYKPNFHVCKKCQKDITEQKSYVGGFEGVVCKECKHNEITISKNLLKILRLMQKGNLSDLLIVHSAEKYNDQLTNLLHPYLSDILPRPPKSLEL